MPSLELPSELASLERARRFVADHLGQLGMDPTDTVSVAHELVANAVVHTHHPLVITVDRTESCIRVEVADLDPRPPQLIEDPDDRGGFGLTIVARLSQRWGSSPRPEGKVVWAETDLIPSKDDG